MNIEFAPRDLLRIVFRRRIQTVSVFSGCVLIAAAYILIATPKYGISTSLLVTENHEVPVSDNRGSAQHDALNNQDRHDIINSHMKILGGRDLAFQVLTDVGLDKVYPDIVEDPPSIGTTMDAAVEQFSKDLYVDTPRDTNLIEVSLLHPVPEIGIEVVNDLISRFLEKQGKVFSNPQSDFVKQQVDVSRDSLAQAQTALENFRLTNHISSIDEERLQLIRQRYDLESQAGAADAHIAELGQRYAALTQSLKKDVPATVPLYSDNDLRYRSVDDTNSKLVELQLKENELLKNYQESSEPVQRVRAEIAMIKGTIGTLSQQKSVRSGINQVHQDISTDAIRTAGDLAGAKAARERLATQITDVAAQLQQIDQRQATYQDLQRQYDITDQNYRNYTRSIEEARITDDLNRERITGIAVVEPATASVKPERPRRGIVMLLGVVLGLIISLLTAFLREMFDERMSTPQHAEGAIGVPVLASFTYQAGAPANPGLRHAS